MILNMFNAFSRKGKFPNRAIDNKGFSLPEMLVSVVTFSILGSGLLTLLIVGTDSWQNYNANILSQREGRNAVASLTRDLREANNIVLTQSSESVSLTFNHPDNGNISYDWTTAEGTNANRIIRTTDSTSRIIAKNITSLIVTDTTSDATVNITATVLSDRGRSNSFQLVKKIKKR